MSQEDKQKLRERQENRIQGMFQNKLYQRIEKLIEQIQEIQKG